MNIITKFVVYYETLNHSLRVGVLVYYFSRFLQLSHKDCDNIVIASMLHDMGKVMVDSDILCKMDTLSVEDFKAIKNHSYYSYKIARYLGVSKDIAELCLNHHESKDGNGYPNGVYLEDYLANILKICDMYDALRSDRVYRKGHSMDKTLDKILLTGGFDKVLFEDFKIFIENFEEQLKVNNIEYTSINVSNLNTLKCLVLDKAQNF